MRCRKCGIIPDLIRPKWWQWLIPTSARYYCPGCGKKYFRWLGRCLD